MISLYSGTPGSGKSYHVAEVIYNRLRKRKRPVIANFDINDDMLRLNRIGKLKMFLHRMFKIKFKNFNKLGGRLGAFTYCDNSDLSVAYLVQYAREHHEFGKEGQTLLIIDECATIFNSRAWDAKNRQEWIKFFQQHRKLGFNVILVSQNDRLIDRQIRAFVEYEIKHRAVKNYNLLGIFFSLLSGGNLFAAVTYWYGVREKVEVNFVRLKKSVADIYNTFEIFN